MGYDLRDFFFECAKECTKQGLQADVHRQCENMRMRAKMLPAGQREAALAYIDDIEQRELQRVEQDSLNAGAVKELLKMLGIIS